MEQLLRKLISQIGGGAQLAVRTARDPNLTNIITIRGLTRTGSEKRSKIEKGAEQRPEHRSMENIRAERKKPASIEGTRIFESYDIDLEHDGILLARLTLTNHEKRPKVPGRTKRKLISLICKQLAADAMREFEQHRMASNYVAGISHEIATPLNSIIGMLSMLEDTNLNSVQMEYVNVMRQASFTLMGLISDILDISKLEAKKLRLNWSGVDLISVISDAQSVVALYSEGKRLKFNRLISGDVPSTILTDGQRLKQILINLLGNAYKFTERGSISVRVERLSEEQKASIKGLTRPAVSGRLDKKRLGAWVWLKFEVADTGIGIRDEDKPRLFRAYEQLETGLTKKYRGVGLGLAITRKICELMGGTIWFESEHGKGSTFTFVVPVREYDHVPEVDPRILAGKCALLVDDKEQNLIAICKALDRYRMEHRECSSGRRAYINYIENGRVNFDIGLFDIYMPEFNGVRLAECVANSRNPFPVIALSSADPNGDLGPHFAAVLRKPYTDEQLINTIATVLSERSERPALARSISHARVHRDLDLDTPRHSPRKNIRILVVEDDIFNSRVMVSMLNALGYYDVETAGDGKRAVKLIGRNRGSNLKDKCYYDLVFMDIIMPIMDGFAATKKICKMFEKSELRPKICAVTGYISEDDRKRYKEAGMDDFLIKPLESKDRLIEVIARLFPD